MQEISAYLLAIAPAFLIFAVLLLAVPARLVWLRIILHILFFVLARDAMTPQAFWQVTAGSLRFTAPALTLLMLAALSLGLVAVTSWLERGWTDGIRWCGDSVLLSLLLGLGGAALIAALAAGLKQVFGLPSLPPLAVNLLPVILLFSLAGNCYEELLFRGLLQQYLQQYVSAVRAALISGLLFSLCHAFLAITVTRIGAPVLVFTLIEGIVAALVYLRAGLLGAVLAHGLAIFILAAGYV